jgi:hypothetical protein
MLVRRYLCLDMTLGALRYFIAVLVVAQRSEAERETADQGVIRGTFSRFHETDIRTLSRATNSSICSGLSGGFKSLGFKLSF